MASNDPARPRLQTDPESQSTVPPSLGGSDTQPAPVRSDRRTRSYPFLSPPRSPGEMGWLGPYRVLDVLGEGAMGVVFRAEKPPLDRQVALKVIGTEAADHDESRRRFLREAQAASALHHDHVIPIYDFGEDAGVPYLAMPLLQGETLQQRLRRAANGQAPPLSLAEAVQVGREVAEGLAAAHALGMVHRDIKPANLWLEGRSADGSANGPFRVKILDFGLARRPEDSQITHPNAIVGTPAFMSPEQVRAEPADARSDLFSLGCVLYLLTTGDMPFPGDSLPAVLFAVLERDPPSPRALNQAVPDALADLIHRLLDKDPTRRPVSAAAVARELADTATGNLSDQAEIPKTSRRSSWRRVAIIGLAGAILTGGVLLWQATTDPRPIDSGTPPKVETKDAGGKQKPSAAIEATKNGKETAVKSEPMADPKDSGIPSKKGVVDDE